jgi:aryl-alcohol dehydrogenase-like predicted oxidoreductase
MRYRTFPGTDVTASEIGFGAWTVSAGWWGDYSDDDAVALIRGALDLGITFFDTAPTYGKDGRGETILAKALRSNRDEVVYSTKLGYDTEIEWNPEGHQERPHNLDLAVLRRSVESSLRRLQSEHIDLLQLHNPRMDHLHRDDVWALMEDLKREGKIRAYGIALGPAIGWRDEGLYALEDRHLDALFIIHNLLEQDPGREFIEAARRRDVGVMVRVPHSSGLLEGKYTKDTTFDANDHRSHRKREWLENGLRKLDQLTFLTEDRDVTIGQAALRWLLADPLIVTVLPNIYGRDQLVEFAEASEKPDLTADDLARIAELYDDAFGLAPAQATTQT